MKIVIPSLCLVFAGACVSCQQMSPNVYETRDAGVAMETFAGVIQSARPVTVQGEGQLGTILGAVAGGIGGAQIGGGVGTHIIGGLAGSAIGGMAGRGLEKGISKQSGIEYIVKTEDGQLHTVVQAPHPPLRLGQKVFVQLWGPGRARVIPGE